MSEQLETSLEGTLQKTVESTAHRFMPPAASPPVVSPSQLGTPAPIPSLAPSPAPSLAPVPSPAPSPVPPPAPSSTLAHPFDDCDRFKKHPPIPVMNFIIDSQTGEILEDLIGQP